MKRPIYKRKCPSCSRFWFIKAKMLYCLECYEKRYGKYEGEDRQLYVYEQ